SRGQKTAAPSIPSQNPPPRGPNSNQIKARQRTRHQVQNRPGNHERHTQIQLERPQDQRQKNQRRRRHHQKHAQSGNLLAILLRFVCHCHIPFERSSLVKQSSLSIRPTSV